MSEALETELAARMPWLHAKPESWWEITGSTDAKHLFEGCLARVIPPFVTGDEAPLFEVLVYGAPFYCTASAITEATELMLVHAREPRIAYYEDDQADLDRALRLVGDEGEQQQ